MTVFNYKKREINKYQDVSLALKIFIGKDCNKVMFSSSLETFVVEELPDEGRVIQYKLRQFGTDQSILYAEED